MSSFKNFSNFSFHTFWVNAPTCLSLIIPSLSTKNVSGADLSYNKDGSKWEFGISVTNLFNDTSLNRDSFNQLFTQTRSYIVQPRYTVFRIKYDLTGLNTSPRGGGKGKGRK